MTVRVVRRLEVEKRASRAEVRYGEELMCYGGGEQT